MDSFSDLPEPKTCCFGGLLSNSADFSVPHWNLFFLLMGASNDSKQATVSRKTCPKHIRGCTVPIKLGHFKILIFWLLLTGFGFQGKEWLYNNLTNIFHHQNNVLGPFWSIIWLRTSPMTFENPYNSWWKVTFIVFTSRGQEWLLIISQIFSTIRTLHWVLFDPYLTQDKPYDLWKSI